ncbi:hypothetical protein [Aquibacillus albus]|uniref:F0F1-type ATP synthase membrane subunit c/vacuolar-type H+-ATPase subunit K n=1 Tax=Aquibacillus albus TaxID=1168171 RepID=A0ABS2N639_9BACI|nr:hypothetical protein [Aquibacillus albus]MBM7573573.1 F0F1-type ATP synthase membrane subunit c/vacuolar-type H+-ATPase subunit K [Aquibacillus albus]
MNTGWLFVLASAIAVVGIVTAFKQMMVVVEGKLEKEEVVSTNSLQKQLSGFFIRVALIESIPIVLIVFGFIQMETWVGNQSDILLPLIIIIIILVFGIINVFLSRGSLLAFNDLPKEAKTFIQTLIFIGMAMVSAIPIISIVAMFIMLG